MEEDAVRNRKKKDYAGDEHGEIMDCGQSDKWREQVWARDIK